MEKKKVSVEKLAGMIARSFVTRTEHQRVIRRLEAVERLCEGVE